MSSSELRRLLKPPSRLVLWGGRPGVDRQFGGRYDALYEDARRRATASAVQMGRALLGAGITTEQALRAMAMLARGLRRAPGP